MVDLLVLLGNPLINERKGVFIRNPTDYVIKHNKEKQKYLVHELFDFYGP